MNNILRLIFFAMFMITFVFYSPLSSEEKYMGELEFGFWYTFWYPSSANLTTGKELDISIAPSLLKEVKFAMNFGEEDENHFAVDYVADKFFENFEMEAQKRVGEKKTETMKQIMALFRRQFGDYFIFEGIFTYGSFKGKAGYDLGDLNDQDLVDEMQSGESFIIDNKYYSKGDVFVWNTNFQIYDARLVLNFGDSCGGTTFDGGGGALAAGVKFMNYTTPVNYNFKSDSSSDGISVYTFTSNFKGTYLALTFMNWPGESDSFRYLEGWSQIYVGKGTLENDFLKSINVYGFGYDLGLKVLIPVVSSSVRGSFYLGFRGVFQVLKGEGDTSFTSSDSLGNNSGTVEVLMSDYFFGPIAGVQLAF